MPTETSAVLWLSFFFASLIFVIGIYCVLVTYNLVRALIGLELLIKAVTLLLVAAGYAAGRTALLQGVVITLIVVEVVVMAVAVGIVIAIHRQQGNLDARGIRNLKG